MSGEEIGHAWNKVNLGGDWYNWDMTNVASNSLTPSTMGKCLKTDEEIEKQKIYRNNNSTIRCIQKPEQSLIDEINTTIKANKRNIPKLPKENVISKITQKISTGIQNIKNTILKKKTPLLPEGSTTQREENKAEIEFSSYEPVVQLEDRKSAIWRVQSWDKGDVQNRFTTSYLELSGLEEGQEILDVLNNKNFQVFYKALLESNVRNEPYVGRIDLVKDENGELSFMRISYRM